MSKVSTTKPSMAKVSATKSAMSSSWASFLRNSFIYSILLKLLSFFSFLKSSASSTTISPTPVKSSLLRAKTSGFEKKSSSVRSKRARRPATLFPVPSKFDSTLSSSSSVTPCSASFDASFVPVKDGSSISWNLSNGPNDNNTSSESFAAETNTTCSTVSEHESSHLNNQMHTIPTFTFDNVNGKSEQKTFFSTSSEHDEHSLNEIDLDQLASLTEFVNNDEFQHQQEEIAFTISTPDMKETSKSENNSPSNDNNNNNNNSSPQSLTSSPDLDGIDYTFAKTTLMANANVGKLLTEDDDDEYFEDDDEENGKLSSIASGSSTSGKKHGNKTHQCPFCSAQFRIRGYLTRHIKKHAIEKAYTCPFYNPNSEHKCHPNGGFSRRDTYKTHLKARHFRYPPGTRCQNRSKVGGKCGVCGTLFETNENWVENHIENGECSGLPIGYQCRSGKGKRKKSKNAMIAAAQQQQQTHQGQPNAGVFYQQQMFSCLDATSSKESIQGVGICAVNNEQAFNMSAFYEQQHQQQMQMQQLQHMQHQQQQQQQQQNASQFLSVGDGPASDIIQRSISPLDGIYAQHHRAMDGSYVAQEPRGSSIQEQQMIEQQQQFMLIQQQQSQQQQQQMQQQMIEQQPIISLNDEELVALSDEYSSVGAHDIMKFDMSNNNNNNNNSNNNLLNIEKELMNLGVMNVQSINFLNGMNSFEAYQQQANI